MRKSESPSDYQPVFSSQATDFLIGLRKRRQQKALSLVQKLVANPFLRSDYAVADETGRAIEHLLVEDFVFAYWVDHAVREIRFLDIEDAS